MAAVPSPRADSGSFGQSAMSCVLGLTFPHPLSVVLCWMVSSLREMGPGSRQHPLPGSRVIFWEQCSGLVSCFIEQGEAVGSCKQPCALLLAEP